MDKSSGRGYAQITGGDKEPQLLYTGNGSGYEKADLANPACFTKSPQSYTLCLGAEAE